MTKLSRCSCVVSGIRRKGGRRGQLETKNDLVSSPGKRVSFISDTKFRFTRVFYSVKSGQDAEVKFNMKGFKGTCLIDKLA